LFYIAQLVEQRLAFGLGLLAVADPVRLRILEFLLRLLQLDARLRQRVARLRLERRRRLDLRAPLLEAREVVVERLSRFRQGAAAAFLVAGAIETPELRLELGERRELGDERLERSARRRDLREIALDSNGVALARRSLSFGDAYLRRERLERVALALHRFPTRRHTVHRTARRNSPS